MSKLLQGTTHTTILMLNTNCRHHPHVAVLDEIGNRGAIMKRFNIYTGRVEKSSVWRVSTERSNNHHLESLFPAQDMRRHKIRTSCIPFRCCSISWFFFKQMNS